MYATGHESAFVLLLWNVCFSYERETKCMAGSLSFWHVNFKFDTDDCSVKWNVQDVQLIYMCSISKFNMKTDDNTVFYLAERTICDDAAFYVNVFLVVSITKMQELNMF